MAMTKTLFLNEKVSQTFVNHLKVYIPRTNMKEVLTKTSLGGVFPERGFRGLIKCLTHAFFPSVLIL